MISIRSTTNSVLLLVLFLCPGISFGATEQSSELEAFRHLLEAQQAQIESLQQAVYRQQADLDRQRILIASIGGGSSERQQVAASLSVEREQQVKRADASITPVTSAPIGGPASELQQRLDYLERRLSQVPEDPLSALGDASFPGSWRLPGTTAALRMGGYVKMNIVDSFDPLVTRDRFIAGSIPPTGVAVDGAAKEFTLTARQSRVNLDLRDNTGLGNLRAFVEGDFAGPNDSVRLRHAYGQFGKMLAGQTWSTLMDLNSSPDELDFEGINGRINARQPQLRFFPKLGDKLNLKLALEDPRPDVSGGTGISELPDVVIGIDNVGRGLLGWMDKQKGWDVRAAVIARQIEARALNQGDKKSVTGWGITASGRIPVSFWSEQDQFMWQLNYGEGIGRYINDLGTIGGQDAIFSPEGRLKTLPVFAGYVSYQHWWSSKWRSNATFSWVAVDSYDFQSDPDYVAQFGAPYERTLRGSINVLYNPVPRLEIGTEMLWGERRNANDTKGDASQIQISARYLY